MYYNIIMTTDFDKDWYKNELKSKEGKVILPADFGSKKYATEKHWLIGLKPSLYVKMDAIDDIRSYFAPSFVVTEMIYAAFAQYMGADAVNVKPMEFVYKNGTIEDGMLVEDFVENRETQTVVSAEDILRIYSKSLSKNGSIITMCENTLPNHLAALDEFAKTFETKHGKPLIIDPDIESNLFRMILIDFVLLNKDRHTNNISYILEDKGSHSTIKLSKIYDNSLCLGMQEYNKQKGTLRLSDIIHDIKTDYKPLRFLADKPKSCFVQINEHAQLIAKYLEKNPQYFGMYKKATEFNIENLKAIIKKQVPNYPIDNSFFKYAKKINSLMVKTLATQVVKQGIKRQNAKNVLTQQLSV